MDHFPLPQGKSHLPMPHLAKHSPYTRGAGDFEGYPSRKGWTQEDVEGHNSFGQRTHEEVHSFFQSWLFFGCAIEVLAVGGVEAQHSDFLNETGSLVSTRKLPRLIRQWRTNVKQLGNKGTRANVEGAIKIATILKRVSSFVDIYCLPYYGVRAAAAAAASGPGNRCSPLLEEIWASVIALGHTLGQAMITYYDIVRTPNHWGASRLLKQHLLDAGWCPMDVERSMTDIGIDGHYYLSQMKRAESHISHEHCTKNECTARMVDKDTYQQKHVRGSDDCDGPMKVDVAAVIEIIKTKGCVPVVRWDTERKQLDVASSHMTKIGYSDPPFVAISHVWSDGMGNLVDNALLECQLNRIQNFVHSVAQAPQVKGSPQHFWLDTLCVPVGSDQRAVRREAIQKMADTYKAASAVLVLSSSLEAVSTTDSEYEKSLAFYLANWNRRLWTCQEGILAMVIMLQFADKAATKIILDEMLLLNQMKL